MRNCIRVLAALGFALALASAGRAAAGGSPFSIRFEPAPAAAMVEDPHSSPPGIGKDRALASLGNEFLFGRIGPAGEIALAVGVPGLGQGAGRSVSIQPALRWREVNAVAIAGLAGPRWVVYGDHGGQTEAIVITAAELQERGRLVLDLAGSAAVGMGKSHVFVLGTDRDGRLAARAVQLDTLKSFPVALPENAVSPQRIAAVQPARAEARFIIHGPAGRTDVLHVAADRRPGRLAPIDIGLLCAYLGGVGLIGYFTGRKITSGRDMFLGGGRVPGWAAGLSIVLTNISAISLIALPSRAFATDATMLLFLFTPVVAAPLVLRYIAPMLRAGAYLTAYEVLGARFGPGFRQLGSWLFCAYEVGRIGVLLVVPSLLIAMITGIPELWCIVLTASVTIGYTTFGGYEAVVWTDVFQGLILMLALIATPVLVFVTVGSASAALDTAWEAGRFRLVDSSASLSREGWLVLLFSLATSANSYLWHQPTVQRILSARSERDVRSTVISAAISSPAILTLMFFGGALLFALYDAFPERMAVVVDSRDEVFASFVVREMPAGVAGLVVAAIFAVSMSSLSGAINSLTAVIAGDLVPSRHRESLLRTRTFSRWATAGSGIAGAGVAMLVARSGAQSLFDLFIEFTNLLSGSLAGVFVLALFGRRFRPFDATVGFTVSVLAVLLAKVSGAFSFMLYGTIGTATCVLAAVISAQFQRTRDAAQRAPAVATPATGRNPS
jgi:SSS family transporter